MNPLLLAEKKRKEDRMIFDKDKVLTPFTADKAKKGDWGWVGDYPNELADRVEKSEPVELEDLEDCDNLGRTSLPFISEGNHWHYFYPAPYEFMQKKWVEEVGLKVGDSVKLTRGWCKGEAGYGDFYRIFHEKGKVYTVTEIKPKHIKVDGEGYIALPYFAIEKVKAEMTGYIRSEEWEREEAEKRRIAMSKRVATFKNGLPPRYKDATFDNFVGFPELVEFLKSGKSAVLHGGNGTGKTHLGYAYCRYFVEQGKTVRYILAYRFFEAIKGSFDGGSTARVLGDFGDYDYLVIDEIDKAYRSQLEFIHLYHLVNERYNFMLPTILITNASSQDLVKQIGASTLDRIASDGAIIEMKGENYRQKSQGDGNEKN